MFHERMREIAKLYPNSPAVVWQGEAMSYGELDKLSDEIAAELSAQGVGTGHIVPITIERGAKWIAYSLGAMKTGAAYAPISPSTPAGRLEYILNDIKNNKAPAGAIAVYYTSGSTGVPKGVILYHSGVMALCQSHTELINLTYGVRGGVQDDMGFDAFLLTTLPVLYVGGTIYMMNDTERLSLIGVHRFLIKNKIDSLYLTARFATEYMRTFDNKYLRVLIMGGEALRAYTPRSYTAYNIYGPTECTAYVTAHKLTEGDSGDIPIGKPKGRNRVFIIDGELYISGPQLAAGYLGLLEETAQKFIPNPYFNPDSDDVCYRMMYRTGDLAEWSDNGELLYRGRIDNQVKISGYRIEPGEVEIALAKCPDLLSACVVVKRTPGKEPYLAAYFVPQAENVTPGALKDFLSQNLPFYMIPRKFIMLDKLPLNPRTGKVDHLALPEP